MKVHPTKSVEPISRLLKIIFYGFKSIGLAPVSLNRRPPAGTANCSNNNCSRSFLFSKIGVLYNIALSIVFQIISGLIIPKITALDYSKTTPIIQTMDLTRHILIIFTSWFLIVYWAIRQEKAVAVMNRLLNIHRLLSGCKELPHLSKKRTLTFAALQIVFNVSLWTTCTVTAELFFQSLKMTCGNNLPIFIIYCFLIEYSIILRVLERELDILNDSLLNFKEFPLSSLFVEHLSVLSLSTNSELAVLEFLHKVRTSIFEVSQQIAEFFSFPVLPSIASLSLVLISNCYYLIIPIVAPLEDASTISYTIDALAWIIMSSYPIVSLSFNVTKISEKAQLTGYLVHKLLASSRNEEIIKELKYFSLQLVHEKVSFTAYGFFSLDCTLLQSMLGASATYLFIIVQFMRSSDAVNT